MSTISLPSSFPASLRLLLPSLLGVLSCGLGCREEPGEAQGEPVWDAVCHGPDLPPWTTPDRSQLDDRLLDLDAKFREVTTDLMRDSARERLIADLLDAWDPAAADPTNARLRMQLERHVRTALEQLRQRVRDATRAIEERHHAYDQIIGLGDGAAVGAALCSLLEDDVPEELRARAAWDLGTHGGDEVLDTLVFEFRTFVQAGRHHPELYYERDEYVLLFVAAALVHRGILTPLPYLVDLDRRAERGERTAVTTRYAVEQLAPIVRRFTWLVLREHLAADDSDNTMEPTHALIASKASALHAFWMQHGYAPREVANPPEPTALDSRLAWRLLRRMPAFREKPLRPVDEARHVLSSLGVLSLSVLQVGLRDRDLFVREYSLDALARLGGVAAPLAEDVVALIGDVDTRTRAFQALAAIGVPAALERWSGLALADDAELRLLATLAIGRTGARDALPCLLRAVTRFDPANDPEGALARAFALSRLERVEGLAAWKALRPVEGRLDPIRFANLRSETVAGWRSHEELARLVPSGDVAPEAFWNVVDVLIATFGTSGPFPERARPR